MFRATEPLWFAVRCLRARSAPLRRGVDRLEAKLVLGIIAAVVAAVPMSVSAGNMVHRWSSDEAETQSRERVPVEAVLTEDVPERRPAGGITAKQLVSVQWRSPDGAAGSGEVEVPAGADAGDVVTVWLDESGDQVPAPLSERQARNRGVLAGFGVHVAVIGAMVAGYRFARRRFDEHRGALWEGQWRSVAPMWTRRDFH